MRKRKLSPKPLSQTPGTKQPQPELFPLASLIRDTVLTHKAHWRRLKTKHAVRPAAISRVAASIGMSNSTLSNISLAYYPPDVAFIAPLAEQLNLLEIDNARTEGRSPTPITAETILDLIPDSYRERKALERSEIKAGRSPAKTKEAKTVWLAWIKLSPQQRAPFWPRMLRAAADDFIVLEQEVESPVTPLVDAIANLQIKLGATDLDSLVAALLAKKSLMQTHPEATPLRAGLESILSGQGLPQFETDPYTVTMLYLAGELGFEGDVVALLKHYCPELDLSAAEQTAPAPSDKRSAQEVLKSSRTAAQKRQK